jgi:hypothetical protein
MDQAGEMAQAVCAVAVDYSPLRRPHPPTFDQGVGKVESLQGPQAQRLFSRM